MDAFNHDKTWRIEYLSPTDGSVEKLVNNEYIRDCISFSDEAILTIKEVTACNPFFIQMLCQEAVERSREQVSAEVCKFDVKEVSDWLVRQSSTTKYVRHLYSPLLEAEPIDLAVIGITAEEETRGHRSRFVHQDQIIERIKEPYRDRAINKIGELVRREILMRNPDSADEIRVMLPLFRDWFNDNKAEYNLWVEMLER